MKKFLLFSAVFMAASLTGFAATYSDVSSDHKYYEAVEYLTTNKVVNGYGDGTFKPELIVNRAEAMKMVVNAFAVEKPESYTKSFSDVKSGTWFFDFVMSAAEKNIVQGYDGGTFRPGNNVNFAEAMKMILLSGQFQVPDSVSSDVYRDVKSSDWFAPYFVFGRDNNIIQSNIEGKVLPHKQMSRGEIAEIIYRLMEVKKSGKAFRVEETWESFVNSDLDIKINLDHNVWRVNNGDAEVIFWRADSLNNQFSPGLIYENSGRVWVTKDLNSAKKSSDVYFNELQSIFKGGAAKLFEIDGLKALELVFATERRVDWYIAMSDGSFLVIYTEFGNGVLGGEIKKNIEAMLRSLKVGGIECEDSTINCNAKDDNSDALSKVFSNILVEGKGMESLNLFNDKTIIETDVIGVGTGPVDYYYVVNANYTFKYERAADVILDKREGRSSKF